MIHEAIRSGALPHKRPPRRWTRRQRFAVGFLAFLLGALLLLWYVGVFGGNVRIVDPGRVYRSAQITGGNLETVLQERKIQTVINLRGGNPGDAWYDSEKASCDRFGARMVDIPFSAVRMPPPERLRELLQAFDNAKYPVLFHCRGGADRSGLAGTLYLHLYRGLPLEEAQDAQLTWRYGHIRWGQARPMSDFFQLYREQNGGLSLRDWIETKYPALYEKLPESLKIPKEERLAPRAFLAPPALPAPGETRADARAA